MDEDEFTPPDPDMGDTDPYENDPAPAVESNWE
jgi:hypothetical protein